MVNFKLMISPIDLRFFFSFQLQISSYNNHICVECAENKDAPADSLRKQQTQRQRPHTHTHTQKVDVRDEGPKQKATDPNKGK